MEDIARCAQAGARVRRARLAAGKSQADIAAAAAVSQSSVSRIELGQASATSISTLAAVAGAVGLALEVLVRGPADVAVTAMQGRCHRLVVDLAVQGGWMSCTTIATGDPSESETLLIRPGRREVAIIQPAAENAPAADITTRMVSRGLEGRPSSVTVLEIPKPPN